MNDDGGVRYWQERGQQEEHEAWLADRAAQASYQEWLDTLDTTRKNMPRTSEMIESKYLKKEEVGEDGTVVTIADFERVNVALEGEVPEHKWTMRFNEFEKPMVLNSTNINLCEKALGSDNTDDWIGKKIIVYNEPNISFGNKLVGGIRIKAFRKAAPPREIPPKARSQSEVDDDARFGDER